MAETQTYDMNDRLPHLLNKITFHTEVKILMHISSGWFALLVEIAPFSSWTVLKAAAGWVIVT